MQNKNKIGAIIQARMSSVRLPGKIFKLIDGKPLIEHIMLKVKKSKIINTAIIATTTEEEDKILVTWCKNKNYKYFLGKKNDVLSRFYFCAKEFDLDTIVRITSDNPLIDMDVVNKVIQLFIEGYDYVANNIDKTFPHGLDVEVFSFQALEKSFNEAHDLSHKEHVTQYIRHNSNLFKIKNYRANENYSDIRVTLDTQEDYDLIKEVIKLSSVNISLEELVRLFEEYPHLKELNRLSSNNHKKYMIQNNII